MNADGDGENEDEADIEDEDDKTMKTMKIGHDDGEKMVVRKWKMMMT